jgi:hypothetical protein
VCGKAGRQPGQFGDSAARWQAAHHAHGVDIDQIGFHRRGAFGHYQVRSLQVAVHDLPGVHPPDELSQGLGALPCPAAALGDRPILNFPGIQVEILCAVDPLRGQVAVPLKSKTSWVAYRQWAWRGDSPLQK